MTATRRCCALHCPLQALCGLALVLVDMAHDCWDSRLVRAVKRHATPKHDSEVHCEVYSDAEGMCPTLNLRVRHQSSRGRHMENTSINTWPMDCMRMLHMTATMQSSLQGGRCAPLLEVPAAYNISVNLH